MTTKLQLETWAAFEKVPGGTVAKQSAALGIEGQEPIVCAMDGMIRYAKTYAKRYDRKIGEDYVLGPEFASVIKGLRGLLNGDGAVAMETGRSTDSKDNGMVEAMYWTACELAGLDGDTLEVK